MIKNFYIALGVSETATQDEIQTAFKKLARQYHPDVAPGNTEKFTEVNEAYETLGDIEKRRIYDEERSKALVTDLDTTVETVVSEYFNQFHQKA